MTGVVKSCTTAILRQAQSGPHSKKLVVAGAVEDLDGVREELGQGVQRFDGAFGAAGKIEDERKVACDGYAARQNGSGSLLGAFAAHFFGQAGNHFFGNVQRGFGSVVAGAKPGAASGKNEINAARVCKLAEVGAHLPRVIGALQRRGDFPAEFTTALHHGGTGEGDAFVAGDGIGDGEDGNAHRGGQFEGNAARSGLSIRSMDSNTK